MEIWILNGAYIALRGAIDQHQISTHKPSLYEILPKFGLPSGLLPDSVTSYTLAEDGRFEVTLEKPCYIEFDYEVYYDKKISGVLNIGSITELKGIRVKRFFMWLDVNEIRVDLPPSNSIYFKVGLINRELDVHRFLTVHSCKDKAVSLRQIVEVECCTLTACWWWILDFCFLEGIFVFVPICLARWLFRIPVRFYFSM